MGFFNRLKQGLEKSRKNFSDKIEQIVVGYADIDEELLEELEVIMIAADMGVDTTLQLIEDIRGGIKKKEIKSPADLRPFLRKRIEELLTPPLEEQEGTVPPIAGPKVILVVGVNGVGKTTTIGKLGTYYKEQGQKVMFAAADTFRAAAIEQLEIWANRAEADIIKQVEGSDPAAVAFDAVQSAKARKVDLLLIDTAGRLQTKVNLMEELKKIYRVIGREIPGAPQETLLVLDATTGQNAISQAKLFCEAAPVTGVVLTKLDGTAKGGMVVSIKKELGIPVQWIGVGESSEDLRPFVAADYAAALLGEED